jgi:hypothetical protein
VYSTVSTDVLTVSFGPALTEGTRGMVEGTALWRSLH